MKTRTIVNGVTLFLVGFCALVFFHDERVFESYSTVIDTRSTNDAWRNLVDLTNAEKRLKSALSRGSDESAGEGLPVLPATETGHVSSRSASVQASQAATVGSHHSTGKLDSLSRWLFAAGFTHSESIQYATYFRSNGIASLDKMCPLNIVLKSIGK